MKRFAFLAFVLISLAASADEATVQYRLTGLFQPDRVEDLRQQAASLWANDQQEWTEIRLADVNYETTTVSFAYDPASKVFKRAKPDQVRERIDSFLRNASKGAFNVSPLSSLPAAQQHEERIAVAGLDCKGCAYGAYRTVAKIDGVERATVSFKEGRLTAWIDPAKTNRAALLAALQKAQVTVLP